MIFHTGIAESPNILRVFGRGSGGQPFCKSVSPGNLTLLKATCDHGAISLVNALALAMFLLWYFSHGFSVDGILDGIYELQADSLAHGHLNIIPGPQEMYFHDILIYWGKYYFYQGLLPSILLWGSSQVLGRTVAHYLITYVFLFVFIFYVQRILVELIMGRTGSLAPLQLRTKKQPHEVIRWDRCLAFLLPTGKMPVPPTGHDDHSAVPSCNGDTSRDYGRNGSGLMDYLPALLLVWVLVLVLPFRFEKHYFEERWFFTRFVIYEQQIFFGLAVATAGVFHLIRGLRDKYGRDLMLAGFLFSVAAWIRVTWFPFALLVLPVMALLSWKWTPPDRRTFRFGDGLVFGVLAGALIAGLLYLNYVRFGSPFDFGLQYISMGNYAYQRDVKQYFSAGTRFWNFWYTIALYYVSPEVMERLSMTRLAYAQTIGYAPAILWNNPQFAFMLIVVPWALIRAYKRRKSLCAGLMVLLTVVIYFNVLLGVVSTVVVLRYFMDSYYFLMLLCIAALSVFMRPVYVLLIMLAALSWHMPATVESFAVVRPELRAIRLDSGLPLRAHEGPTWFIEPNPKWLRGLFSATHIDLMTRYNAVGIEGEIDGYLFSKDCFAAYLMPGAHKATGPYSELTISGLRALRTPGSLHLFFEQRPIAQLPVAPDRSIDAQIQLPFRLEPDAPYQILGLFVPKGSSFLPPRPPGEPVIHFRELRLESW